MELKFNSQICTTKEQSKRLLELGLKPETADMNLTVVYGSVIAQWVGKLNNLGNIKVNGIDIPNEEVEHIPAWSLHRLLCMLDYDNADTFNIMPNLAYEDVIATISLRVGCGTFNKEYLNK